MKEDLDSYNKYTWSNNPIQERMDPKSVFARKVVEHLPNPNEFIQWIIKTKLPTGTELKTPPWNSKPTYRNYSKDANGVGDYFEDQCVNAIAEYREGVKLFDEEHQFHLHHHHFINNIVRKLYNEFEILHENNPGVPGEF